MKLEEKMKIFTFMMSEEYIKDNKKMEDIWNNWIDEAGMKKHLETKIYEEMIATIMPAFDELQGLLRIKKLENDPENRLFLINKYEEYLKILKDYTEEELKCK